jgi:hypothetical protein
MNTRFKLTTTVLVLIYMVMVVPLNSHSSFHIQDEYDIKGLWLSSNEGGHHQVGQLEICLENDSGTYYGKDPAGRIALKNLVFDESDREFSGKMVSSGGREMSVRIVFLDNKTIEITGRRFLHRWSFTMSRDKEKQP